MSNVHQDNRRRGLARRKRVTVKKTSRRKRTIQKRSSRGPKQNQSGIRRVPLKLTIELVPSTSWYNNLRKQIPRQEWDKLRRNVYAEYNHRCGICGAEGRLNCHEIWEYDDTSHVQKLTGFIALCDLCHHVKHLGFAGVLYLRGELDIKRVIQHFLQVNECDDETYREHSKIAGLQHHERSKHSWQVDLGNYRSLIETKDTVQDTRYPSGMHLKTKGDVEMADERTELFSERVFAGSRSYFFDVKESADGTKYLVISESREVQGKQERHRVMVFEENLGAFFAGLEKARGFLGKQANPKSEIENPK